MNRHFRPVSRAVLLMMVLAVTGGSAAMALQPPPAAPNQPPATKPLRRGKTVKQPIVDLEKQAMERRPGQVMPGDPPREKFAPPIAEPKPATPAPAATETVPAAPIKPAPAPISPDSGPRPLPKAAEKPATSTPASPASEPAAPKAEPAKTSPPAEAPHAASVAPAGDGAGRENVSVQAEAAVLPMLRGPQVRTSSGSATFQPVAALASQPVRVRFGAIEGPAAGVQWRTVVDGPSAVWQSVAAGQGGVVGAVEVRTGLDTQVQLAINDGAELRLGRLSRIRIEAGERAGVVTPRVHVLRGTVELAEVTGTAAPVFHCPDRADGFVTVAGCRVSYSAFRGTKVEAVRLSRAGE